jgi:hypothetical protein
MAHAPDNHTRRTTTVSSAQTGNFPGIPSARDSFRRRNKIIPGFLEVPVRRL